MKKARKSRAFLWSYINTNFMRRKTVTFRIKPRLNVLRGNGRYTDSGAMQPLQELWEDGKNPHRERAKSQQCVGLRIEQGNLFYAQAIPEAIYFMWLLSDSRKRSAQEAKICQSASQNCRFIVDSRRFVIRGERPFHVASKIVSWGSLLLRSHSVLRTQVMLNI